MRLVFAGRRFSVVLAILMAACAPAGRPSFADESAQATVEVENRREVAMEIFVVDAVRVRLGRVGPKATAVLRIPAHVVPRAREMEFMATSSGRSGAISGRLWVGPGERVGLVITQ